MDRLTSQDAMMLWPDDVGWPQDIGAVAVLDGGDLLGPDGRFPLDAVRSGIENGLAAVPRFRQVLLEPRWWLGRPVWVDDVRFDIRHHVRALDVASPGGEPQLLETVERIRRTPLDRSRPLWQVWFLPGLAGGRVGLYLRVHHVVADGPVAVAMVAALLSGAAAGAAPGVPWHPAPAPTDRQLFEDTLQRMWAALIRMLTHLRRPGDVARSARTGWHGLRAMLASGAAPRTSLNRSIGPDRRLTLLRSRLDLFTTVAHAHDATVNDVLLCAVAGGLRNLLLQRVEPVADVVLRAFVPVSMHRDSGPDAQGNRLGMVIAPLPVGVADPADRLHRIAAATAAQKRDGAALAGAAFRNAPMPRVSVRMLARQRSANTQVSNVPGPPGPLSLAGARLLEIFPFVPLMGNLTLLVGALSYAGQFNIAVVSDPSRCPDVDVFASGLTDTLTRLVESDSVAAAGRGGRRT